GSVGPPGGIRPARRRAGGSMTDTVTPESPPVQQDTGFGRLRLAAWLSFIAEVLIIGTGGAVRLTGSGLGCSEWPLCTPESLVPTEELGIHGVIEFGNRTLTGVVGVLALTVLVLTFLHVRARRGLRLTVRFALGGIVAGIAAAVVAGAFSAPVFVVFSSVVLVAVIAAA